MYIVVSKWQVNPGKDDVFKENGRKMREFMRSQPGVEYVESFRSEDGNAIAIIGYTDEASYKTLMADGGAFDKAAKQNDLESGGKWLWSERGEAVDREPAMA